MFEGTALDRMGTRENRALTRRIGQENGARLDSLEGTVQETVEETVHSFEAVLTRNSLFFPA